LTNTDAHKITPNQWCHVAGVFSGGNVTLYKDGVATAAVACSNQNTAASSNPFQLGKGYTSGYLWMDGEIASPMAFDTALSASQIKEIYQDSKVIIPSNVSQTNLRGWWTFAEGAGTICYDGSGRGIDGEFQNMEAADWSTGQTGCPQLVEGYNRPMRFDNPQYIEVPQDSTLDVGTSDFTFAAWTFLETGSQPNIVMQFAGAGGWRMVGASGKVRFSVFDNGWTNYASMDISPALTLNQWNHVAVSVNRDGNAQSYINGVAKSYLNVSGVTGTLTNAYPLRFGAGSYTSGAPTGDYIAGTINEAIMYIGTALNAADIASLAATGPNGGPLPPDPTTMTYSTTSYSSSYLKGYWRNDGIVTWTDRSGNGNTGTANGSPNALLFKQGINGSASTSTGRDNQGFPLKYKDVGAIGFNGSDNLIDIPHSTVFDSTVFSYCSWVYVPGDTTADGKVAHLSNNSAGNGWGTWQIRSSTTTNQLYYQTNNAGTWQTYTMNNYFTGAGWYYICVTHIQGSNPTVYRDAEVFAGTGTVTQDFDFGTDPLYIGCRKSASSFYEFWNGQIANGQYYNRVLSQAEIKQNYNAQKSRFT